MSEKIVVGIDVSKAFSDICILSPNNNIVKKIKSGRGQLLVAVTTVTIVIMLYFFFDGLCLWFGVQYDYPRSGCG